MIETIELLNVSATLLEDSEGDENFESPTASSYEFVDNDQSSPYIVVSCMLD